jgi:hypothetical protein
MTAIPMQLVSLQNLCKSHRIPTVFGHLWRCRHRCALVTTLLYRFASALEHLPHSNVKGMHGISEAHASLKVATTDLIVEDEYFLHSILAIDQAL